MVKEPRVRLQLTAADQFAATAADESQAERICEFASRWAAWHGISEAPSCHIELLASPRMHIGLGVGTQLGLAIASGLNRWTGRECSLLELAASVGRGQRSAIGTHGFQRGGLIFEHGKTSEETLSPLAVQLQLPDSWRFVLVTPQQQRGLSGQREREAFRQLPPVTEAVTARLQAELEEQLLPAARQQDFDAFSASVFRFGRLAGECFSPIQGGPYNGPHLQRLVDCLLDAGVTGVGQTSWGPTIFALVSSQQRAEQLVSSLREAGEFADAEFQVSAVDNRGACFGSGE